MTIAQMATLSVVLMTILTLVFMLLIAKLGEKFRDKISHFDANYNALVGSYQRIAKDLVTLQEEKKACTTYLQMHPKDFQVRVPKKKPDGTEPRHQEGSFVKLFDAYQQGYLPEEIVWLMQNSKSSEQPSTPTMST